MSTEQSLTTIYASKAGPRSIKMFLCPQAPNFSKKCPPKRRVIATKLNLQQKCVNHFFSSFLFVFLSFSWFFFVFVCFSSFFIIPNLFPFKTETGTSDQCPVQFTAQNFVCSTPFANFLVLENSAFSASTHIKILQLQMKLVYCELILFCFEGRI